MNSASMKVRIPVRSWVVFLALLIVPAFGAQSNKNTAQKPAPQAQPAAPPAPQRQANQPQSGRQPQPQADRRPQPQAGRQPQPQAGKQPQPQAGKQPQPQVGKQPQPQVGKQPQHPQPNVVPLKTGGTATVGSDGRVRTIDTKNGVHIERPLRGVSTTVSEHNRVRVVTMGAHRGFVQRQYMTRNGRTYVYRTYVVNNVTYTRVYNTYYYDGRPYYGYIPVYYYHPAYYGWAYEPWPTPVYYTWGWYSDPWYRPYGYYFAPEPYYPTTSLWLTDYLIAENLKLSSEAQQNAPAAALTESDSQSVKAPAQLDPETKRQIAEEVRQQLAAEKQAASAQSASPAQPANSNDAPPALDPRHSVFIVSSNLNVSAEDGQECALTPGDVITRIDDQAGSDNGVEVKVNSSKKEDCHPGAKPRVQVSDLQEMHNHFREQIDSGLKMLADNQGKGGLPKAPDISTTAGEVAAPVPDKDVEAQLQKQQTEADQAEKDAAQTALAGQGGSN